MRSRNRETNVFNLSAIDLFCSAMGAFMILALISLKYYGNESKVKFHKAEFVFVLDTTGSMGDRIDYFKSNIESIVVVLQRLLDDVKIGFIEYKDILDTPSSTQYPLTPMPRNPGGGDSPELVALSAYISGLQAGAPGSPNRTFEEAVEVGLQNAVNQPFSSQAPQGGSLKQFIIVIGDAPAFDDKKQLCYDLARSWSAGLGQRSLHAVYTPSDPNSPNENARSFFASLAQAGGGEMSVGGGRLLGTIMDLVMDEQ